MEHIFSGTSRWNAVDPSAGPIRSRLWTQKANSLTRSGHRTAHQEDGTEKGPMGSIPAAHAIHPFGKSLQEANVRSQRQFDDRKGPTWHCIVGRNFGSFVTHGKLFRTRLRAHCRIWRRTRLTHTLCRDEALHLLLPRSLCHPPVQDAIGTRPRLEALSSPERQSPGSQRLATARSSLRKTWYFQVSRHLDDAGAIMEGY